MKGKGFVYYAFVFLVLAALLTREVDGRRRILKGRRTVTRTYYRELAIPAWAIVILVGLGEVIIAAIVFFVMKRVIVDAPISGSYTPAATMES